MLVAVTFTGLDGMAAGAVYRPEDEIVPTLEAPPGLPLTDQLTAVLLVPDAIAVNCCDCPSWRLVLEGESETETEGVAAIVTVALADALGWTELCAVTITEVDGTAVGAVYTPEEEIVPTVAFPPATPFTIQIRDLKRVPDTV